MRDFRTIVDIPQSENKINHRQGIVLMGSCFSDSIGRKLADYKFPVDINPLGVIYNPASISSSIEILVDKKIFTEEDVSFANERWFSFYHHSDFSNRDKDKCLDLINFGISASHDNLKTADYLFITLGTSWVFKLQKNNRVVSNCHKLPAYEFSRHRLSVEDISSTLQFSLARLHKFNPSLKVIFTVSPIRHWKDGAHGNQLSKAALLLAVERILEMNPYCSYFPSYEIMMDELRDYRFYDADMLHISPVAVDYFFDRFADCYFSSETKYLNQTIEKIVKASKHRAFNPNSDSYIKFLKSKLKDIEVLEKKHPHLNLIAEKEYFEEEMKKYS
ncbi:MAG: GSCFA domain-containing protein [Bacteroidales bacterium]|nr:GSCFA domain-containing protein [Bacteroidales bacterium]MCF8458365.1 GSCFA domain-containing protein [Bacteroidales bacterium]